MICSLERAMNANENLPKQSTSLDWFDDSQQTVGGQAQQWTFNWGFAHLACETCPISKNHRSKHSRW